MTNHKTIIIAFASLAIAITILIRRRILGHRLKPRHWIGLGLILIGVALVSC